MKFEWQGRNPEAMTAPLTDRHCIEDNISIKRSHILYVSSFYFFSAHLLLLPCMNWTSWLLCTCCPLSGEGEGGLWVWCCAAWLVIPITSHSVFIGTCCFFSVGHSAPAHRLKSFRHTYSSDMLKIENLHLYTCFCFSYCLREWIFFIINLLLLLLLLYRREEGNILYIASSIPTAKHLKK